MTSELIRLKTKSDFARFNGTTPLPAGAIIIDECTEFATPQQIVKVNDLSRPLKNYIYRTQRHSLNGPDMPFREVGLSAFSHRGGLTSHWATSNSYKAIEGDALMELFSPVLDQMDAGHIPDEFIDVHSHPCPEYIPEQDRKDIHVLISANDFRAYQVLSNILYYYAGRIIPVHGIVRPVGKRCGNVAIMTSVPFPIKDEDALEVVTELKEERGQPYAPPPHPDFA